MPIYEMATWQLMWKLVENLELGKGEIISRTKVVEWFKQRYPKIKQSTISAHLLKMSINAPSRIYYNVKPGSDDLFYQIDSGHFRLYDKDTDPPPLYEGPIKQTPETEEGTEQRPYSGKIPRSARSYTSESQNKPEVFEKQLQESRQEIEKLRKELEKTPTIADEIHDAALKARVIRLGDPPLDTLIREAGVVLEDRLRATAGDKSDEVGVRLVDAIFDNDKGKLQVSSHPGEQDGVKFLYRGAIQFIRNPPMHKLVNYEEETARIMIRLIDSLLVLLSELKPIRTGDVALDQIKLMLRRAPIIANQRKLYKVLYDAGEKGLTNLELLEIMDLNRMELSGVLGSLGRRINQTEGLKDKGGTNVVFEFRKLSETLWIYRMRPIMRMALEEEGLV
jgi:hypothetical protein